MKGEKVKTLWTDQLTVLFTYTILAYFIHLNFEHTKMQIFFFFNTVFQSRISQFWVFGGTRANLMTSHCHSVAFYTVLCVVSALNAQGFISAAK